MKKGCPVYNLSFVRDQTQEHKIRTIRPLDGTHAIGKGDVDDLGGGPWEQGTISQGTARDIEKPLPSGLARIYTDQQRLRSSY